MDFIDFTYARFSQGAYVDARQASLLALRHQAQISAYRDMPSARRRQMLAQAGAATESPCSRALLENRAWPEALAQLQEQWHQRQAQQYAPFWRALGWDPSPEQKFAIVSPEARSILVAAAGSGKTSTLLARIAFLAHRQPIPDRSILVLAFNRAVRQEIRHRLAPAIQSKVVVHTFHSLAWDILRQVYPDMQTVPEDQMDAVATTDCLATLRTMQSTPTWQAQLQQATARPRRWVRRHQTPTLIDPVLAKRIVHDFSRLAEQAGAARGMLDPLTLPAPTWQAQQADARAYSTVATACLQRHLLTRFSHQQASYLAMIPLAISSLTHSRYTNCFHHIFVDEYQDVSPTRTCLLLAMLDHNPSARLVVVGDDWQSIYGFTGSRHDALQNFGLDFGPHRLYPLQRSFRFPDAVADLAGRFIQRNPAQIRKQVQARANHRPDHVVLVRTPLSYDLAECRNALHRLVQLWQPEPEQSLGILVRYNKTQSTLLAATQVWPGPTTVSTIHKAKGLEWDFCLVWDLRQGAHGFPDTRTRNKEDFAYAEERRLMYVALTRCRTAVAIAYPQRKASPFVKELRRILAPETSVHLSV